MSEASTGKKFLGSSHLLVLRSCQASPSREAAAGGRRIREKALNSHWGPYAEVSSHLPYARQGCEELI